jgi:hypothetical protein
MDMHPPMVKCDSQLVNQKASTPQTSSSCPLSTRGGPISSLGQGRFGLNVDDETCPLLSQRCVVSPVSQATLESFALHISGQSIATGFFPLVHKLGCPLRECRLSKHTMASKTWQETAQSMQKHRADTIAAVDPAVPDPPTDLPLNVTGIPISLLSEEVISITDKFAEQLISDLASGKLTSVAVTKAFLQRAGLASRLVNCCTELLPETALERAKFLDDYYSKHKKPIGPLHGLPISVKEHVGMKGLDLNAGFVSWVGNIAPDDAVILKLLRNAGCVFYARTTQPQTLMHLETSNNIYGVTVNPYNAKLTCGGSSGGEGALMGMRGSCLGIGSDIGGSIRSPAANNGLFGLRPTTFRLPVVGWTATMLGEEQVRNHWIQRP